MGIVVPLLICARNIKIGGSRQQPGQTKAQLSPCAQDGAYADQQCTGPLKPVPLAGAVTGKERYAEDASRKCQQETGRGNQPPDERQRRYCDPVDVWL